MIVQFKLKKTSVHEFNITANNSAYLYQKYLMACEETDKTIRSLVA